MKKDWKDEGLNLIIIIIMFLMVYVVFPIGDAALWTRKLFCALAAACRAFVDSEYRDEILNQK